MASPKRKSLFSEWRVSIERERAEEIRDRERERERGVPSDIDVGHVVACNRNAKKTPSSFGSAR